MCNREIWNIENNHITAILRNKTERKYKTEKFILNLVHDGKTQENPPNHKHRYEVSRGNFGIDATPEKMFLTILDMNIANKVQNFFLIDRNKIE